MKLFGVFFGSMLAIGGLLPSTFVFAQNPGDLVTCSEFDAVYYVSDDRTRLVFPNEKIYFSWYEDFSGVKEISCSELSDLPLGENVPYRAGSRLIKLQSVPTVYAVAPGGVLHALPSEERAIELYGTGWSARVDDLSEAFFPRYTVLADVSESGFPNGTIIKNADTGTFYYVQDQVRHVIPAGSVTNLDASIALELSAPFDGTIVGDDFTESEWDNLKKLDQLGEEAPEFMIPDPDLATPVLEISEDLILNSEPFVLTWEDSDEDDDDLIYELQEDTGQSFSSPTSLLAEKDVDFKVTKEAQNNPKYYYRVRASRFDQKSAWSNVIRVDVLNMHVIEGVPDTVLAPNDPTDMGDVENGSVPMAAANILYYFDQVAGLSTAQGISANLSTKDLAGYLSWFMGLNGLGSEDRTNIDEDEFGVLNEDIEGGLDEFIRWQGGAESLYGFDVPRALSSKTGFNNWDLEVVSSSFSDSAAFTQVTNALKDGTPAVGVFEFWNPVATGDRLGDVRFYSFGDQIENSDDAVVSGAPNEVWRLGTSGGDFGHGVTVVGYIPNYDVDPDDDDDDTEDYLVVYDGWSPTFSLMAIPVQDWSRFFLLTPQASVSPQSTTEASIVATAESGELVSVSWSSIAQATYYELQWDTDETFESAESFFTTSGDGVTDYVNTHVVSEETIFYYRIRGWNEIGAGDWGASTDLKVTP